MLNRIFLIIILLNISLNSFSNNANRYFLKGYKSFNQKKYNQALGYFFNGLKFKTNANVYNLIGHIYSYKKNYRKALIYYRKAFRLKPNRVETNVYMGLTLRRLKMNKECIKYFDTAIRLQKLTGKKIPYWWYFNPGFSYLSFKKYSKSLKYFSVVYSGNYNGKIKNQALFYVCFINYYLKNYNRFLKNALLFVSKNQEKSKILLMNKFIANVYLKRNKISRAIKYAKKCGKDFWIYKIFSPKKFTFTCRYNLKLLQYRKPGMYYIPLPYKTEYQKLVSVKSNPDYLKIIHRQGETYALYDFTKGFPSNFTLSFTVHRRIIFQKPGSLSRVVQRRSRFAFFSMPKVYTHNAVLYDYGNPLVNITFNKMFKPGRTNIEQASAFARYMRKYIPHVKVKYNIKTRSGKRNIEYYSNLIKKISGVFKYKTGHCVHRPNAFTALIRKLNIPARSVLGFALNTAEKFSGLEEDGHGLVEVLDIKSKKWYQISIDFEQLWLNSWVHVLWYRETVSKPKNYLLLHIAYYLKKLRGSIHWKAEFIDKY